MMIRTIPTRMNMDMAMSGILAFIFDLVGAL
jgi:hypothetical protein